MYVESFSHLNRLIFLLFLPKDLESDEDLFGESKPEVKKIEDASPFGKKGGMFSGGGTLFGSEPVSKTYLFA